MMKLNEIRWEQARQYMLQGARSLERALFRYEFENGSFTDVLIELSSYQNEDGGFGHGLEPDLRCKESSALATTRALEILRLHPNHPERNERVISALQYLEHTYVPERSGWDIIPKEAEQSPRAIWWQYGAFKDHWGNPNADIIAYFIDERELYPLESLDSLVRYALDYLNRLGRFIGEYEGWGLSENVLPSRKPANNEFGIRRRHVCMAWKSPHCPHHVSQRTIWILVEITSNSVIRRGSLCKAMS